MSDTPRPAAGYSGTPLARKLGVKGDQIVFLDNLPDGLDLGLGPGVDPSTELGVERGLTTVVSRLPPVMDLTVTFHTSYARLVRRLPILFERTTVNGMVWVCWPKKAGLKQFALTHPGLVVDVNDGRVRELGLELGFVDVKVAAIDHTWSGLKFVRRVRDR